MYRVPVRYEAFKKSQVRTQLTPKMIDFVKEAKLMFIATTDGKKNHCAIRYGEPGFIKVHNENRLSYTEFDGTGVCDSLENLSVNPSIGILIMDFDKTGLGLHITGSVESIETIKKSLESMYEVYVNVSECFIQCKKYLFKIEALDDVVPTEQDYFTEGE